MTRLNGFEDGQKVHWKFENLLRLYQYLIKRGAPFQKQFSKIYSIGKCFKDFLDTLFRNLLNIPQLKIRLYFSYIFANLSPSPARAQLNWAEIALILQNASSPPTPPIHLGVPSKKKQYI